MAQVTEEKKNDINIKEIRKKLEARIEEALPQEFKERHNSQIDSLQQMSAVDQFREVDELTAKRIIEAVLFSTVKPVEIEDMRKVLRGYKTAQVEKIVTELQTEYERDNRSFRINKVANGYELATLPDFFYWLNKAEVQKKPRNVTQAMLETLAVLAYKQPVTRSEVEEIRGVDCSGILATLLERNFIKISGRKEVPGRPLLYATTEHFLQHFGLATLTDLPRIHEIREIVEAAIKKETLEEEQKIAEQLQVQEERKKEDDARKNELLAKQAEVHEKYREIADSIEGVKVFREKELSQLIENPSAQPKPDEAVVVSDSSSSAVDMNTIANKIGGDSDDDSNNFDVSDSGRELPEDGNVDEPPIRDSAVPEKKVVEVTTNIIKVENVDVHAGKPEKQN